MSRAWVVRPNPHGIYRMREFLDENIIAIGWPCIGDLSNVATRDDIKQALQTHYSYSSNNSLGQAAGNILRFVVEMSTDDYVVVPDGAQAFFGVAASGYKYLASLDNDAEGYPHQREVQWLHGKKSLPRSLTTGRVWNSLKGQQSVFETYPDDVRDTVENKPHLFTQQTHLDLKRDYLSRLQTGLLRNVNPNTFEDAVCELLSKYYPGLRRLSTANSPTGDTDLKAELPGGVVVRMQVKNFYGAQGGLEPWVVQQLAGSMDPGDQGIVVTSGTVGQAAMKEAASYADKTIGFIDGQQFVDILFETLDGVGDESLLVFGLSRTVGML